jgi:hypothetical protein
MNELKKIDDELVGECVVLAIKDEVLTYDSANRKDYRKGTVSVTLPGLNGAPGKRVNLPAHIPTASGYPCVGEVRPCNVRHVPNDGKPYVLVTVRNLVSAEDQSAALEAFGF